MRIRAFNVRAARIDGRSVDLRACTLAVRIGSDGRRGWEASAWVHRADPELTGRADIGRALPVSLETELGPTLNGEAFLSVGRAPGSHAGGAPLFLVGVGPLRPWPA